MFYAKALDGVNFGANVRVSDVLGPPPAKQFSDQSEPWLDVDANGNPKIAWTDWRNDDSGHRDPESLTQDADVFFDESSDGGVTFGTDQRVNDDVPIQNGYENSRPALVTAGTNVDLVWQDGRVPAHALNVYFAGTNVPLGSTSGIKVNEVLFEPVCPGEPWVEFVNKDPLHVNMRGMEWADEDGFTYRFPSAMPMVPPGAYVVVHIKAGTDEAYFGQSQPNALHLYAGVPSWQRHLLDPLYQAGGLASGDFDGDGDMDVAAGTYGASDWALYVYLRPSDPTASWPRVIVDSSWASTWVLAAVNIDLDMDLDLVSLSLNDGPADKLTWYENTASGWMRHAVDTTLNGGSDVAAADVDVDGFPDLIASAFDEHKIYWFESDGTPQDGGWIRHTISTYWGPGLTASDFDGDAKPDVFSSRGSLNDIGWYRNPASEPWPYTVVRTYPQGFVASNPPFLDAGDIDGDGDIDVASGATTGADPELSTVWWYENRLNSGQGWASHVVDTDSFTAGSWGGVELEDVDRDGRRDIVVAQTEGNAATLFRNNVGGSPAWTKITVDGSLSWPMDVSVTQIDGDCWWDIAATDRGGNALYWYTKRVLDRRDQISLYTGSVHTAATLVDFVAWGGDAEADDDIAVAAGQWSAGTYVDIATLLPDQTIGRDAPSTDTNVPADWAIRAKTPGAPNV